MSGSVSPHGDALLRPIHPDTPTPSKVQRLMMNARGLMGGEKAGRHEVLSPHSFAGEPSASSGKPTRHRLIRQGTAIIWGIYRRLNRHIVRWSLPMLVARDACWLRLERLGSAYGGWYLPVDLIDANWICYCVGVGCDATFDLALIDRFGCHVVALDPTPRAITYMDELAYDRDKLRFLPIGIWSQDTSLRFFAPADRRETSHSIFNLHQTNEYFDADCKRLSTIARELNHDRVDLVKLDIEGAWGGVLETLGDGDLDISVVCVEFDSPTSLLQVLRAVRSLKRLGFKLVHREKDNCLFVHRRHLSCRAVTRQMADHQRSSGRPSVAISTGNEHHV